VPPANMTLDEERFFDSLVNMLRKTRQDLREQLFGFDSIIEEKLESARAMMDEMKLTSDNKSAVAQEKQNIARTEEAVSEAANGIVPVNEAKNNNMNNNAAEEIAEPVAKSSTKKLKITADMPSFLDGEMKAHGPFKAGAIAELPCEVAQILLARKAAEAI
jgi:rubrerythrin